MTAPVTTAVPAAGLSPAAVKRVRPLVREMLTRVPAFSQLGQDEQQKLANDMVRLVAYLDDPNGVVSETKASEPLATAQADANEQTRRNLSASPGFAGKDFVAGAAQQGTDQFVRLVQNVDFPAFVGGLINNVFRSIVETSIEQMRAYAELVANVAKSASEYMNENIGLGQGRDYLVDRFPDLLDLKVEDNGNSRLSVRADDSEQALRDIHNTMGLPGEPLDGIDDEEQELMLVNAARLAMAKSRQQLLASMVLLGINRIVVTDGSIVAKVRFDMRATDEAKRRYRASAYDRQTSRNKNVSEFSRAAKSASSASSPALMTRRMGLSDSRPKPPNILRSSSPISRSRNGFSSSKAAINRLSSSSSSAIRLRSSVVPRFFWPLSRSKRRSMTVMSLSMSSDSMELRSRAGSMRSSGWGTFSSSKARTTSSSASLAAMAFKRGPLRPLLAAPLPKPAMSL